MVVGPDLVFNSVGPYHDAFVAKVNPQGTNLEYCGYIGGTEKDYGKKVAVDSQGQLYLAGYTRSGESSFPTAVGPFLTYSGGNFDAFVVKIDAQGTAFLYCGYIGGTGSDSLWDMALDANGSTYITGATDSDELTFPVRVGPDLTHNGSRDCYVAKVNSQGTGLDFCGYIGGSEAETGFGVVVGDDGSVFVAGETVSDETTFPVAVGPDLTYNGPPAGPVDDGDAFIAKVNQQGTALVFCGYIGGANNDEAMAVGVDAAGCSYVAGKTYSDEGTFPVRIGPSLIFNGSASGFEWNAYVAKIDPLGQSLDYCGYLFRASDPHGIVVTDAGEVYLAGETGIAESEFPTVVGPDLTWNGAVDGFVLRLPPEHVLLRRGNVGTRNGGEPVDIMYVNGSSGLDAWRGITIPSGTPVSIAVDSTPSGPIPAAFVLYAYPGEANATDLSDQPYNIGTACFPMPLSTGTPAAPPLTLANTIGYPGLLGIPLLPGVAPAPCQVIRNRLLPPGTWTLQGVIQENATSGPPVSLTNTIVLIQQ